MKIFEADFWKKKIWKNASLLDSQGAVQASQEAAAKRQAQIKEVRRWVQQIFAEDWRMSYFVQHQTLQQFKRKTWIEGQVERHSWRSTKSCLFKEKSWRSGDFRVCQLKRQGTQSLEKEQLQLASKVRQLEGGRTDPTSGANAIGNVRFFVWS